MAVDARYTTRDIFNQVVLYLIPLNAVSSHPIPSLKSIEFNCTELGSVVATVALKLQGHGQYTRNDMYV